MFITAYTRGGVEYTPRFLTAIDIEKCIGCGRCYKVCGRDVMTLRGVNEDGDLVECSDDEDDDDDEILRKVMIMVNPDACVGCGACNRVCPKDCQTHEPVER
ncbi:ferredoxin III, nif-specific [Cereibacter azotoformans]|uniref:Ferredoxin III n=2 Tax=Cereibacter TaxID=1653176 RepID=A0A2T5K8W8_9RHOB|nr:ferredoxin III, nif-specific [Cereibacter azotoformans]AXQ93392.1 ferredoxin III, nif-specific [Cereibacter sphaeroides]MBO4168935.1 ferredoxin III, nif-specific [Cereibacter azotoformans]PTR18866.1 Nif-specific ferredoxin III [Cereibacter azotoformans]UIJ31716.1 ferredoxin III, nif-specific [Cereibacter azotoformans]ULB09504.1 ferredoxin III, nif-specific [Cereibacter azotoformans]